MSHSNSLIIKEWPIPRLKYTSTDTDHAANARWVQWLSMREKERAASRARTAHSLTHTCTALGF